MPVSEIFVCTWIRFQWEKYFNRYRKNWKLGTKKKKSNTEDSGTVGVSNSVVHPGKTFTFQKLSLGGQKTIVAFEASLIFSALENKNRQMAYIGIGIVLAMLSHPLDGIDRHCRKGNQIESESVFPRSTNRLEAFSGSAYTEISVW